MSPRALVVASAAVIAAAVAIAPASAEPLQLTPVGRLAFPEKAYVVDLAANVPVANVRVSVRENGRRVSRARVEPLAASGLRAAAVLALDASDSMAGAPYRAALAAARTFVDQQSVRQEVGVVAFNSRSIVLEPPTRSREALYRALSHPPALAYGTTIYDTIERSLALLAHRRVSTGSVVLLSDGTDIGSSATLDGAVADAHARHVRIFTVGLRSGAFARKPLEEIAQRTGGTYTEANAVSELAPIFAGLSGKFTNEFVLRYRSRAAVGEHVHVVVGLGGRTATAEYDARGSAPKPYHRSLPSRFFLSPFSLVVFALLDAFLIAYAVRAIARYRPHHAVVQRVSEFIGISHHRAAPVVEDEIADPLARTGLASVAIPDGFYRRVAGTFEIARISISPAAFIFGSALATTFAFVVLLVISPPLALLAALVPVFAKAWVSSRLQKVRDDFAQQLPDMLQLLASALRSGHSFVHALSVVIDQSPDPIRSELSRVTAGDRIGVPPEDTLREVAKRMDSRDMEQVALLSELNRTAGGNTAMVLDAVVETVRERAEVRGMARTLTAQGRYSRWILTMLPLGLGLFLAVTENDLMRPLYSTGLGQTVLAITALMVVAGSFWIKRIIEIKV